MTEWTHKHTAAIASQCVYFNTSTKCFIEIGKKLYNCLLNNVKSLNMVKFNKVMKNVLIYQLVYSIEEYFTCMKL
jgi:hypothetical protein